MGYFDSLPHKNISYFCGDPVPLNMTSYIIVIPSNVEESPCPSELTHPPSERSYTRTDALSERYRGASGIDNSTQ